ncbi:MAG TPA: DNA polymerase III subunit delta' C-terminal domain-containing protein [Anaerolineales bacterium]|nr:DNA polymerase III subunit delta' C-terminal domain-containing protein [Anaerolineales bacterium]
MADNWNMLGHEWAVDMLHQQVAHGEARHAYLFCGPPGLGRRTLALRLAQALNCTKTIAPGIPCGVCRDCKQIEEMRHPDMNVIQAVDEDGVSKENGTLKVDQVRAVQHSLSLRPYQAKYRVALFLRFQEANDNAANALLKTLEEAPAHAILLLTADTPEQLLPTIISRCEVLRLRALPISAIESDLLDRGVDEERARLLAHISGGRPGYARRLVDDMTLLEKREERLNDLQTLLPAPRVEKFSYAEKLAKDKEVMRQTIVIWLSYWRDVMLRVAGAESPLINVDRNMEIEFLAGRLNLSTARRVVSDLESALEKMDKNVNSRLLAEVLLLDWPKV